MANARVTITGKFLGTKDYQKRDSNEWVRQILVFDGDNAIKISDVDGSKLTFGDDITLLCDIYSGDYGVIFRAVST